MITFILGFLCGMAAVCGYVLWRINCWFKGGE